MATHGLFQQDSPSFFSVTTGASPRAGARAMGQHADDLADFCIPCNPYFPTDEMFGELERNLRTILKFSPSDAAAITAQPAGVLRLNPSTISLANGSTELIPWIDQPMETGKRVDMFLLKEADNFELRVDEYIGFIKRRGGGRHTTPAIELVSHSREPERSIS